MRLFRRGESKQKRDFSGPWGDLDFYQSGAIPPPWHEGHSVNGVHVSQRRALQYGTLYACIGLITDTISTLPIRTFETIDGAPQPLSIQPIMMERPHPFIDVVDWVGMNVASMLLRGNAYNLITELDDAGWPLSLRPLSPDHVRLDDTSGEPYLDVQGVGLERPWPYGRVLHIPAWRPAGEWLGLSPLTAARRAVALGISAEEFGTRYFDEGATPPGILTVPGDLAAGESARLREEWQQMHGRRQRTPAVLSGGMTWQQMMVAPEESQFLETRLHQVEEICRIYRVPGFMVQAQQKSTAWGTGMEQMGIGFVTYTLRAWIVRLERALTSITRPGQYVRLNVAGLLRGDTKSRYESYRIGREWGWLSVDDVRSLEEMPPLPGSLGEGYTEPARVKPVGNTPVTSDGV